jgi:hypothetical protein
VAVCSSTILRPQVHQQQMAACHGKQCLCNTHSTAVHHSRSNRCQSTQQGLTQVTAATSAELTHTSGFIEAKCKCAQVARIQAGGCFCKVVQAGPRRQHNSATEHVTWS